MVFTPLFEYKARLVMAADHPLAKKRYIRPADRAGETLITYPVQRQRLDVFTRFLQPAGIEPLAVRQAELTAVILLWVASQRGVAALPDWVLNETTHKSSLTTRTLTSKGMKGTLYAAVRRSEQVYPGVRCIGTSTKKTRILKNCLSRSMSAAVTHLECDCRWESWLLFCMP